ncbi:hypothetical protein CKM354_000939600 [Cercospora kikuchii]|uniref:FAD-binding PCMH-type domain-containing protein n=1 Tax=Cercospora kikuchii TaxID=84275 RepID=A0A9P3CNX5_9PEZI|nr:uncharacterized protein CKM354_000939600 [Cercospora kikuchii]GIZ46264.1 hypothetical protein CKM354_000939600 [Cercospora kikuchii]
MAPYLQESTELVFPDYEAGISWFPAASKQARQKPDVNESHIDDLRRLLAATEAQIVVPQDAAYADAIHCWSQTAEKLAGVVVYPTQAHEVSTTLQYAIGAGLDIAIKCGGHSTNGASSTDGGVLINLAKMKKIVVDTERMLVHVGGGCLWGEVDKAAWQHGLAVVGGSNGTTGVGGLTLGGGYGMLTGEHGLAIDNLVSAEIVLANGKLVRASECHNSDLFWALRGAGHNFGIITEFTLRAHAQGDIFMGALVFPPVPQVVSKLVKLVNDLYTVTDTPAGPSSKSAGKTMGLLGITHQHGRTGILLVVTYNGTEKEAREIYKPFFDLGPVFENTRMAPYPEVNSQIPAAHGIRSSMKGAAFTLPIRDTFFLDIVRRYQEFMQRCPEASGSLVGWELMDPTKLCASDNGSFATRGFHLNSVIMPMWKSASLDDTCRNWARQIGSRFQDELDCSMGKGVRSDRGAVLLYGNYDQYDETAKDIFGANYPRLQQLKAKYDPSRIFNKLYPIEPAS